MLDPVVVTATREPRLRGETSADLVVVDRAAIDASSADSVGDLLRREAGIQLARNGGPGQPAGYLLRGMSTNATIVLVDGVRVGSASLGQVDLESLSLAQVERIEVLRGPASGLYGADGVGGVIQIFTRRGTPGPLRTTARAEAGTHRSASVDAGLSGVAGGFDHAVVVGHERSRGISAIRPGDRFGLHNPDADGFRRTFGNAQLGWRPAAGHRIGLVALQTRLDSQYDGADFPPPDFLPDASADFRTRLRSTVAALDWRGDWSPSWATTLRAAHQRDDSTSGGQVQSRYDTRRRQLMAQGAWRYAPGRQLVLAWDHVRERVGGDVLADAPTRRHDGYALGWNASAGAFGIEANVRRDDDSAYGAHTTGRLGGSWRVRPSITVRALVGTSFRAPTFNDLYYPFYGVATLAPERGRSAEIGAEWQGERSSIAVTLWRARLRDLIGFDPDPDGTRCPPGYFGCAANVARARLQGLSWRATATLGDFDVHAGGELLDARDADTGERLPRRAAHQENLGIDWTRGPWRIGAAWGVVGSRPDGGTVLGGHALLDLVAGWRWAPGWRLEARLTNALDRRYQPLLDYEGVGRQVWVGVRHDSAAL